MNTLRYCGLLLALLGLALPALAAEPKGGIVDSMFTIEDYLAWLNDSDEADAFRQQVRAATKPQVVPFLSGAGQEFGVTYAFVAPSLAAVASEISVVAHESTAIAELDAFETSMRKGFASHGLTLDLLSGNTMGPEVRMFRIVTPDQSTIGNVVTARRGLRTVRITASGAIGWDTSAKLQSQIRDKLDRMLALDTQQLIAATVPLRQQREEASARIAASERTTSSAFLLLNIIGYFVARLLVWPVNRMARRTLVKPRRAGLWGIALVTGLLIGIAHYTLDQLSEQRARLSPTTQGRVVGEIYGRAAIPGVFVLLMALSAHKLRDRRKSKLLEDVAVG